MEYLVNRLLERSAVKVARSVLRGAAGAIRRLYPTKDCLEKSRKNGIFLFILLSKQK
jgi:hypothetical protein